MSDTMVRGKFVKEWSDTIKVGIWALVKIAEQEIQDDEDYTDRIIEAVWDLDERY